jgi:hypothetical protein
MTHVYIHIEDVFLCWLSQQTADDFNLVYGAVSREQNLLQQNLPQNTPSAPNVHLFGVAFTA